MVTKVEHWNFQSGENVIFYIPEGVPPTLITARVYTSHEGKKNKTLRELEEGIYHFEIDFRYIGKYIIIISEDNIKKMIVIATVK